MLFIVGTRYHDEIDIGLFVEMNSHWEEGYCYCFGFISISIINMLWEIQRISEIYQQIVGKALEERAPVLLLVSPDVDALCSCRILTVCFWIDLNIELSLLVWFWASSSLFSDLMVLCIRSNRYQVILIFIEWIKAILRTKKRFVWSRELIFSFIVYLCWIVEVQLI